MVEVPFNNMAAAQKAANHPTERTKPKLRGIPDVFATLFAVPAVATLIYHAQPGLPTLAATVYGVCLVMLFTVSATYHTFMWSVRTRSVLRACDHSMVYVLIAGSYTPFALLALPKDTGHVLLTVIWGFTAAGALKSFTWPTAPRWLNTSIYVFMGWLIVLYAPIIYKAIGAVGFEELAGGGVAYTLGAVIYARRWPNPFPQTFGYHEVFHVFVVVAGICHFTIIWNLVS